MSRMDLQYDPHKMCDDHLLGNHNEVHQIAGYLRAGAWRKLVGHACRGQVDCTKLCAWHQACVEAMQARGFDHDSPLDAPTFVPIGEDCHGPATTNQLSVRCDDCRL